MIIFLFLICFINDNLFEGKKIRFLYVNWKTKILLLRKEHNNSKIVNDVK